MISRVSAECVKCEKDISFYSYADYDEYHISDEKPYVISAALTGAIVKCGKCGACNLYLTDTEHDWLEEFLPNDI